MEQRLRVWWKMVHRTLSGAPAWRPPNQPLSGFGQARSTIIHRTVWCATGLSGELAEQQLPVRQWSTAQSVQWWTVPQCSKMTRRPNGQLFRTLMVALTWRTPDSAQWLSDAPIGSRNQPTARSGWEAINTPQPPHSLPSKPSEIFIHCKSKPNTPRHSQSNQSTQSPQNQL
jgi:hypothetical protein